WWVRPSFWAARAANPSRSAERVSGARPTLARYRFTSSAQNERFADRLRAVPEDGDGLVEEPLPHAATAPTRRPTSANRRQKMEDLWQSLGAKPAILIFQRTPLGNLVAHCSKAALSSTSRS